MAKKLKKQKKGMNPKAKFTLVSVFKGLVSNKAVIDGSKESPWWVATILLVFSIIIPLLPTFIKAGKVNGGGFVTGANYGFDTQLTSFVYDTYTSKGEYVVSKGVLHYLENGVEKEDKFIDPRLVDNYFAEYKSEYSIINPTNDQVELKVFLWNLKGTALKKAINTVKKQKMELQKHTVPTGEEVKGTKFYIPNILVLTPYTYECDLYKVNTTSLGASSPFEINDWKHTGGNNGLITRMMRKAIKDGIVPSAGTISMDKYPYIAKYSADTLKVFTVIANEAYLTQRVKVQWGNTGIYAGIYAGVVLFLGLMIFILTRGKTNPYKYLNVWHCQKIAWWASVSPAIIGVVLSLVITGSAIGQMAFILLASLRIMWLSMRQLKPVYTQQ